MGHFSMEYTGEKYFSKNMNRHYGLVKLKGDMDANNLSDKNTDHPATLTDICSKEDYIALDMTELRFIDSGGLGQINGIRLRLRKKDDTDNPKTRVIIVNPNANIAEVFDKLSMSKVIPYEHNADM